MKYSSQLFVRGLDRVIRVHHFGRIYGIDWFNWRQIAIESKHVPRFRCYKLG